MILVTGGSGFIGRYLVKKLIRMGEDVRVLVRRRMPGEEVEVAFGDVTDRDSVKKAFDGVDKVYHLAAIFRHGINPEEIWRVNYHGTKNVVKEALRKNARLLHVSTVGVLGYANSRPLNESTPFNPNPNAYSRSKAKAEQEVLEMQKRGLDSVIVRPAFVYGIGSRYGLNLLIEMVVKGRLRWIIGDGRNYIHPVHVEDLVGALITVMEHGKDKIYIAANEEPIMLRKLLDLAAKYSGVKLRYGFPAKLAYLILKIRGGVGGSTATETISLFTKNWFYQVDRLKALNWRQKVDIEMGIKATVEWVMTG